MASSWKELWLKFPFNWKENKGLGVHVEHQKQRARVGERLHLHLENQVKTWHTNSENRGANLCLPKLSDHRITIFKWFPYFGLKSGRQYYREMTFSFTVQSRLMALSYSDLKGVKGELTLGLEEKRCLRLREPIFLFSAFGFLSPPGHSFTYRDLEKDGERRRAQCLRSGLKFQIPSLR